MATTKDTFWCRVFFKEYIKHYRKMTDEQIVRDVRQGMDDLEDLVDDTDTFGSQMVRWSLERADQPLAIASRENGKKGGRPKKSGPMPEDAETVRQFAIDNGLDVVDANNCWDATTNEREGCDYEGNPVTDWKAYVVAWCKTAKVNRRRAKHG